MIRKRRYGRSLLKIKIKKMKKIIFLLLFGVNAMTVNAQNVGIGIATPDASAKLHVVDANRGLLIPKVSIGNVTAAAPVTAPAVGLLVFNTNAATTGGSGIGFYYWNGTQWVMLVTGGGDIDFYEVGTTTAPNNIGDNMYTNGHIAIGTPNPGGHTLIVAETATPSIKVGQTAGFNNLESGRLVFEEYVPIYTTPGTYCGFEIANNGATDLLTINSACTAVTPIIAIERIGEVGFSTNAPTATISVNGDANKPGGGTWTVFSDERLKENITDYSEGLDLLMKIRPVNFSYNAKMEEVFGKSDRISGRVYQGVIAQELQKVAPDMVREVSVVNQPNPEDADYVAKDQLPEETYLEVDPNKFTYALINAVQEQQEIITQQGEELEEIRRELEEIKKMISELGKE